MLTQERDGAVAILTLDYPARRNALAMPMRMALIDAFETMESDLAVRAVVITGGDTFCSGGDISGMNSADLLSGRERFRTTHKLVRSMIKSRLPIIAAVEGYAVGAGLSLALCCDTVVAAEDAKLAAGFGKVGLIADLALLHTLPARIGQGRARQVLLYGEQMTGVAAERIGLVDHVVPKGQAFATAMERARTIAAAAPLPIALTKQYLAAGLDAALDWEREVQASLFLTADHVEGRTAFMEKRTPTFTGR